jgi:DNA topoisomerase IA
VKRINDLAVKNPLSIAKVKQKVYHLIMKRYIADFMIYYEARDYALGKISRPADIDNFNDLNIFTFTKKVCNLWMDGWMDE